MSDPGESSQLSGSLRLSGDETNPNEPNRSQRKTALAAQNRAIGGASPVTKRTHCGASSIGSTPGQFPRGAIPLNERHFMCKAGPEMYVSKTREGGST